ncbi:MAG: spore cortex biosynthesis protein YabQ [Oscillospiraceae bacterium]|nr:spore cortex biosynthesis protein YabQ [Oscillospiraceae bacterium]
MQLDTFFTVSEQLLQFLLSVVLGAGLGVVYDVFRVIRIVFPFARKKGAVCVGDIIFMVLCGFAVFLFAAMFCRGEVRFFCIFGAVPGFILYMLTLGNFVTGVFRVIVTAVVKILQKVYSLLFVPAVNFVKNFCIKINKLFVHSYENAENLK